MDRRKRTRKSLRYKIWWFFYTLEWKDIVKAAKCIYEYVAIIATAIVMFGALFLLPHFFH